MIKTSTEKFLLKRALILLTLLSIYDIVFIEQKWFALAGLVIGGAFSILRLSSYALLFPKLMTIQTETTKQSHVARKSIAAFLVSQFATFLLLLISFKLGFWLFAGMIGGILIVPGVIFINSITEAFGITHNNFE